MPESTDSAKTTSRGVRVCVCVCVCVWVVLIIQDFFISRIPILPLIKTLLTFRIYNNLVITFEVMSVRKPKSLKICRKWDL